jgi:uncharacterized membrane protein YccC
MKPLPLKFGRRITRRLRRLRRAAERWARPIALADRSIEQLHVAIQQGARTLSETADKDLEARLDEFMAATAPVKKTKLPKR